MHNLSLRPRRDRLLFVIRLHLHDQRHPNNWLRYETSRPPPLCVLRRFGANLRCHVVYRFRRTILRLVPRRHNYGSSAYRRFHDEHHAVPKSQSTDMECQCHVSAVPVLKGESVTLAADSDLGCF